MTTKKKPRPVPPRRKPIITSVVDTRLGLLEAQVIDLENRLKALDHLQELNFKAIVKLDARYKALEQKTGQTAPTPVRDATAFGNFGVKGTPLPTTKYVAEPMPDITHTGDGALPVHGRVKYTKSTNLTFHQALEILIAGGKVRRASWPGTSYYQFKEDGFLEFWQPLQSWYPQIGVIEKAEVTATDWEILP